ncbi:MAG: class I SAM-dependent methyltransferase, partial [Methanomassiliicoccales archaeon]|nr:class I SAM-dependent methyltransferase [Methanomassiliicoccales archaeon]
VGEKRPSALDVGCGPGFVMEALSGLFDVKGVDIDSDMLTACRSRGLDVVQADARELPFEDASFDVVYCSFLLLWLKDPHPALEEMRRVSKEWVICLAEPDYGGRIDFPHDLSDLTRLIIEGIENEGGDPFVGRRMRSFFKECGLEAKIGIHPGVWDLERLRLESIDEWRWVEQTVGQRVDDLRLGRLKGVWERALDAGTLFQFNPVFYAIARK